MCGSGNPTTCTSPSRGRAGVEVVAPRSARRGERAPAATGARCAEPSDPGARRGRRVRGWRSRSCSDPGLLHASTELVGRSDDGRYYAWLGWAHRPVDRARASRAAPHPRCDRTVRTRSAARRRLSPVVRVGSVQSRVRPYLSYNLTFVTGAVLNIVCARSLARRLSPHRLVHVVTAVAFLTAPPIALNVQVGLLPLFWAFTLPLLVADALDVVTGSQRREAGPARVLLVVAYLCSVYFVVFGGLAYALIVGVAAVRRRSLRIPARGRGRGRRRARRAHAVRRVAGVGSIASETASGRRHAAGRRQQAVLGGRLVDRGPTDPFDAAPAPSGSGRPQPAAAHRPDAHARVDDLPRARSCWSDSACVPRPSAPRAEYRSSLRPAVMWVFALGPSLKFGGNFVWEHAGQAGRRGCRIGLCSRSRRSARCARRSARAPCW